MDDKRRTHKYNVRFPAPESLGLLDCRVDGQDGCHEIIRSGVSYRSGPDEVVISILTQLNEIAVLRGL